MKASTINQSHPINPNRNRPLFAVSPPIGVVILRRTGKGGLRRSLKKECGELAKSLESITYGDFPVSVRRAFQFAETGGEVTVFAANWRTDFRPKSGHFGGLK